METSLPPPSFAIMFLLLVSPAIGSFLNVLIDRLPRGESIVAPRSTCRACDAKLTWRDLIPILSFLLSHGRCRHCGAEIAAWHLYVEISAIAAAVFACLIGGSTTQIWLGATLLWLLLALAVCDLLWMRLPNLLTGALLLVAIVWVLLDPWGDIRLALIGAAAGSGSFMTIRLAYQAVRHREGLGLGDIKLMAGLGALLGPFDLPLLVLLAALGALALSVLRSLQTANALRATQALPFGAALCAAGALLWVLQQPSF